MIRRRKIRQDNCESKHLDFQMAASRDKPLDGSAGWEDLHKERTEADRGRKKDPLGGDEIPW